MPDWTANSQELLRGLAPASDAAGEVAPTTAFAWLGRTPQLAIRQLPEIVNVRRVLYDPWRGTEGIDPSVFCAVRRIPPRDLARISAARFTRSQRRALARTLAKSWPEESPYTPTAFGAAQVIERATAGWLVDRVLVDEHLRALEDAAERGAASMLADIAGMVAELRTCDHVPVTLGDRFWRASARNCDTAAVRGSPIAAAGTGEAECTRTAVALGVIESNRALWFDPRIDTVAWTAAFSEAADGLRRADTRFGPPHSVDGDVVEYGGNWHPDHALRAGGRRIHPDERRALALRNRVNATAAEGMDPRVVAVVVAVVMAVSLVYVLATRLMFLMSAPMVIGAALMAMSNVRTMGVPRTIRTESRRQLRRTKNGPSRNLTITDTVIDYLNSGTPEPVGERVALSVHYRDQVVEVSVPASTKVSDAAQEARQAGLHTAAASQVRADEAYVEGVWELHPHTGADLPQYKTLSEIGVVSGVKLDLRRAVTDRAGTADTGVNPPPAGTYEDWEPEADYAELRKGGAATRSARPQSTTADFTARIAAVEGGLAALDRAWLDYLIDAEQVFLTMPRLRDDEWPATRTYRKAMAALGDALRDLSAGEDEARVLAAETALVHAEDAWSAARIAATEAGTAALPPREQAALRRAHHHLAVLEDPNLPTAMREERLRQLRGEIDKLVTVPISFERVMEMPALETVRRRAIWGYPRLADILTASPVWLVREDGWHGCQTEELHPEVSA